MNDINTNEAILQTSQGVTFVEFPALSAIPFLCHGFSTKLGGVSTGIFESMNLGNANAPYPDDDSNILENYRRFSHAIGVSKDSLVLSHQFHKTNVRVMTKQDIGKGIYRDRDYDEIDGMITNEPGITLVTKYADCVSLFFVDPVKKVIGLSHSGWRGTVAKIGALTVEKMCSTFSCRAEDIIAVIGPSIGKECFEISEDVAMEFAEAFSIKVPQECYTVEEAPEELLLYRSGIKEGAMKYHCDLWKVNEKILLDVGLRSEHVHISGMCTCCHPEIFFTHRKMGKNRGSLAAFLSMKEIETS